MDYLLRKIEPKLWQAFKARAALEGKTLKRVIVELIRSYVGIGKEEN